MFFFFCHSPNSLALHSYCTGYFDLIADRATNCSCFRLSKLRRKARTRRSASMGVPLAACFDSANQLELDVAVSAVSDCSVELSVAGSHLAHSSLSEYWSSMVLTWLTV